MAIMTMTMMAMMMVEDEHDHDYDDYDDGYDDYDDDDDDLFLSSPSVGCPVLLHLTIFSVDPLVGPVSARKSSETDYFMTRSYRRVARGDFATFSFQLVLSIF